MPWYEYCAGRELPQCETCKRYVLWAAHFHPQVTDDHICRNHLQENEAWAPDALAE